MTTTKQRIQGFSGGFFMGYFEPILIEDEGAAYQAVDADGQLLGILRLDGRFTDPFSNGNTTWAICEESAAHREILKAASQPWVPDPMEFVRKTN